MQESLNIPLTMQRWHLNDRVFCQVYHLSWCWHSLFERVCRIEWVRAGILGTHGRRLLHSWPSRPSPSNLSNGCFMATMIHSSLWMQPRHCCRTMILSCPTFWQVLCWICLTFKAAFNSPVLPSWPRLYITRMLLRLIDPIQAIMMLPSLATLAFYFCKRIMASTPLSKIKCLLKSTSALNLP